MFKGLEHMFMVREYMFSALKLMFAGREYKILLSENNFSIRKKFCWKGT